RAQSRVTGRPAGSSGRRGADPAGHDAHPLALLTLTSSDVASDAAGTRRRHQELFRGTFAPFLRASSRAMPIACFPLWTRRPEPLFKVPRLRRSMADFTVFDADLPYFAIPTSLQRFALVFSRRTSFNMTGWLA